MMLPKTGLLSIKSHPPKRMVLEPAGQICGDITGTLLKELVIRRDFFVFLNRRWHGG
jgi:hypothetical protein